MATSTQKTVYYRRARFSESKPRTLQQILSAALGNSDLIRDRLEALDPKENRGLTPIFQLCAATA